MAAEKSSDKKVMDVSRPGKTSAEPTARPVIVTNRPLITQDPMVSGDTGNGLESSKKSTTKSEEALTPHVEKVIKPPKGSDAADDEKGKTEPDAKADDLSTADDAEKPEKVAEESESVAEPEKEPESAKPEPEEAMPEPAGDSDEFGDDKQVNPEAVEIAEEDKRRKAELEEIIESGKYNVPINSSGKKRTQIITFWLIILAIVLGVVLVDALLDVGILTIDGVPHTNFFGLPPAD